MQNAHFIPSLSMHALNIVVPCCRTASNQTVTEGNRSVADPSLITSYDNTDFAFERVPLCPNQQCFHVYR